MIKDKILIGTPNFEKCVKTNDWSIVPVPSLTSKINNTLIDAFLKDMRKD